MFMYQITCCVTVKDNVQLAIVFRSDSKTTPPDFYRHLLPFMSRFVYTISVLPTVTEFSLLNYGKQAFEILPMKRVEGITNIQNTILNISKKYRTRFSRIATVLTMLKKMFDNNLTQNVKRHVVLIVDEEPEYTINTMGDIMQLIEQGVQFHWIWIRTQIPKQLLGYGNMYEVKSYNSLDYSLNITDDIAFNMLNGKWRVIFVEINLSICI